MACSNNISCYVCISGHNSSYTVKAIESYTAGYRNEISFCKDDIFEVVGKESDRWLIGKINDRTGLFRSEYVTVNMITNVA